MGSLLTDGVMRQSAVKNVFIRGSVVRYVHLPANAVDVPLLEDATRRGTFYAWPSGYYGAFGIPFILCSEKTNSRAEAANQAGKGK